MRLLILGASGRTGRLVVATALKQGHTVTALVREPDALQPHEHLLTVRGTPLNARDIESAFAQEPTDPIRAVLVALAVPRESDSPLAKPTAAEWLIRDSVRNAQAVMRAHAVRRLVVMSLAGCGDSWAEFPWVFKALFRHTQMAWVMRDHDAVDADVHASDGVEWTMVRPAILKDGGARPVRELGETGKGLGLMDGVTRASVAEFMIRALSVDTWDRKAVVIVN